MLRAGGIIESVCFHSDTNKTVTPSGKVVHSHQNQDRLKIAVGNEVFRNAGKSASGTHSLQGVFVVCDGHGPHGEVLSEWMASWLVQAVCQRFCNKEESGLPSDPSEFERAVEKIIKETFLDGDLEFKRYIVQSRKELAESDPGTTATCAVLARNKLFVAHVGDSRALLGRLNRKQNKIEIVYSTSDHDLQSEDLDRALETGGSLVHDGHYLAPPEIELKDPESDMFHSTHVINMTRCLGNYSFKKGEKPTVSPEPFITAITVNADQHYYLLMASDGLWNFVSRKREPRAQNKIVLSVLESALNPDGTIDTKMVVEQLKEKRAAEELAAKRKSDEDSDGYNMYWDDCTIMVASLLPSTTSDQQAHEGVIESI